MKLVGRATLSATCRAPVFDGPREKGLHGIAQRHLYLAGPALVSSGRTPGFHAFHRPAEHGEHVRDRRFAYVAPTHGFCERVLKRSVMVMGPHWVTLLIN